jgi:hypothetical protein
VTAPEQRTGASSAPSVPPYRLEPGAGAATADDLRVAEEREQLLRTELPRVREAATAWRNGLGALLVALVGFGLVRGRSDVSQLAPVWSRAAGVLLLSALVAGACGALLLIRAAHGRPVVADIRTLPSRRAADHIEALAAAAALRRGIGSTLGCTALLVAAVAVTWYGPARERPALQVTTPTESVCGAVVRVDYGKVVLNTGAGEVTVDLSTASAVKSVVTCP